MLRKERFFVLLLLVFLLQSVSSLGVSPLRIERNFEPNLEETFTFTFSNAQEDIEFDVKLDGDLAQYATLSTNRIKGGISIVSLSLKLPDKLEKPGVYQVGVLVTEVIPESQGLAAITAMKPTVKVLVPYPGKYAEMEFNANDAKAGEPADMNLKIYSRGNEEIRTSSRIEIYEAGKLGESVQDPSLSPKEKKHWSDILFAPRVVSGRYVETLNLGEDSIASQEFVEIAAKLDTAGYKSGIYRAVAVVEQTDQILREEKLFKLGELFVDISDWSNEFERGKSPDSIIVELESFWNDPIENVYVTGEIVGKNIQIDQTKSVTIQPFAKERVIAYFDTSSIEEDKFQAKLVVHYGNDKTERIVDLHFARKTDYLLVTLIVVLVLAGIFFIFVVIDFLFLRKKNGKK